MLPSLIEGELREALTEYLGTTFALADDDVRTSLTSFLTDPAEGIFRGPYTRVRLPFRRDDAGTDALDWTPPGFRPWAHQARAFRRLSSRDGDPEPTLVTTGTGSGKTESFLIPVLDHCRRARRAGQPGIKALVLYPMNALANDQARRIQGMLDEHADDLGGVTFGLYTGDSATERRQLRDNPPDVLLTNYKMLDFLLLRGEDARLWSASTESLRYLVLDEFHTYDGAQGTDVAMLLRRLGLTLGVSRPGRPLGAITPVATSATLGDGRETGSGLLDFAARVFGTPFDADAVIAEERLTADEWLRDAVAVDGHEYEPLPLLEQLPAPDPDERHLDRLERVAATLFRGPDAEEAAPEPGGPRRVDDPVMLGRRLKRHPLTRALIEAAARPRPQAELVAEVAPQWARHTDGRADRVLSEYVALLAHARAEDGSPLVQAETQVWVREVNRVDRRVDAAPGFRWSASGARTDTDRRYLPAIYCRHCGRSGWGSARRSHGPTLDDAPATVRGHGARGTGRFRALIHAPGQARAGDGQGLSWLDPETLELSAKWQDDRWLPVLATPDDETSKKGRCPSCGQDDGITFLGSRVATLTSVALGHLFGSADVEPEQKKTLVFTDSVQDAAHRAGYVESRSYALNFRALLHRATRGRSTSLGEIDDALLFSATDAEDRYALLPPDLAEDPRWADFWSRASPPARVRTAVRKRVAFAAALEFGLNARTGRTLELTNTIVAHVDAGEPQRLRRIAEKVLAESRAARPQLDLAPGETHLVAWVRGVLERVRLRGGIGHEWLDTFLAEDGRNRWSIWGGRPPGMPAFPKGRPAPAFPTTASRADNFDSVVARGTWYCDWTARTLGLPEAEAPHLVRRLFEHLAAEQLMTGVTTRTGSTVYRLDADSVILDPVPDAGSDGFALLSCDVCSLPHPGVTAVTDQLGGAPCLRHRCPGTLRPGTPTDDYYRRLYTSGRVRRISAHEHTGLLDTETRVRVETQFKQGGTPEAPNVLTCTPTLELGIDIGDLTAVGLTSLPRGVSGYLQRIGRAGRQNGSALVFAVLPGRGIDLHWLEQPLDMIAGEVTPPACHLDAAEIIRRQYFASLIDRAARLGTVGVPPRTAGRMLTTALSEGSWLRALLHDAREHAEEYVAEFLSGFRGHLSPDTEHMLAGWAGVGLDPATVSPMERAVEQAVREFTDEFERLRGQAAALEQEISRLTAKESLLGDEEKRDFRRVRGEYRAVTRERSAKARQYWISAFEALGLLPNYTLLDDRTRLDVGLTWTDERTGAAEVEQTSYERGSRVALTELAPGSTFYVRGSALNVDAVDVGTERNPRLLPWRFCPSCGWSARDEGPRHCPRCGDARAADTGQVVRAVRFRKASAFASRDGARFGDDSEERVRTPFTVGAAVDVDPHDVVRAWGLRDYPFGAEYARVADVRWVNLGRSDTGGAERMVAGQRLQAPLFQACLHCGVVPAAQRKDAADARHRGWCPQRRIADPDGWVSVALLHELRTQAVRLLVPPIVLADDTVLESVRAALLLGLRSVLGGEPDHLDVLVAPDAVRRGERFLLVLHDLVPGGTGYLARFADPDRVRGLLHAAEQALAGCSCADSGAAACHRCLLPYVPPAKVASVRRDRALEVLREILGSWEPRDLDSLRAVTAGPHETPIERRFRALMVRWARDHGSDVRVTPDRGGDRVTFRLETGGRTRTWTMLAQQDLGGVRPDFVLRADDPAVDEIAVFCDSRRYHADVEHNRLADDARKRAELRAGGWVVWALTHHDLDAFAGFLDADTTDSGPRTGYAALTGTQARTLDTLARNPKLFGPGTVPARALQGDAVALLTRLLRTPEETAWEGPARALAAALTDGTVDDGAPLADGQADAALAALLRGERSDLGADGRDGARDGARADDAARAARGRRHVVRRSAGGATALVDVEKAGAIGVFLGVDDRAETISAPETVPAWRDWLALSNVLQFLGDRRFRALTTRLLDEGGAPVRTPTRPEPAPLDVSWRAYLGFDTAIDAVVPGLAGNGVPLPVPGYEVGECPPADLAWVRHGVAMVTDDDPERSGCLRARGWTVVGPDVSDIVAALRRAEGDE